MTLEYPEERINKREANKIVMQYAIECVNTKNKKVEILKDTNHTWLKKKVLLPCEVAGAC